MGMPRSLSHQERAEDDEQEHAKDDAAVAGIQPLFPVPEVLFLWTSMGKVMEPCRFRMCSRNRSQAPSPVRAVTRTGRRLRREAHPVSLSSPPMAIRRAADLGQDAVDVDGVEVGVGHFNDAGFGLAADVRDDSGGGGGAVSIRPVAERREGAGLEGVEHGLGGQAADGFELLQPDLQLRGMPCGAARRGCPSRSAGSESAIRHA